MQHSLKHDIVLHPKYFGRQLHNCVREKLYNEIEGTCLGRFGYIIAITSITDIGLGVVDHAGGLATFHILYKAIVFRPFKGEIMDGVVKQINRVGIFVDIGPVSCFINRHSIPPHYEYEANIVPACYKAQSDDPAITVEEKIRVKIIGTRIDMSGLFAVGTLMDDFLGIIDN